jgi:hypothetical protein
LDISDEEYFEYISEGKENLKLIMLVDMDEGKFLFENNILRLFFGAMGQGIVNLEVFPLDIKSYNFE